MRIRVSHFENGKWNHWIHWVRFAICNWESIHIITLNFNFKLMNIRRQCKHTAHAHRWSHSLRELDSECDKLSLCAVSFHIHLCIVQLLKIHIDSYGIANDPKCHTQLKNWWVEAKGRVIRWQQLFPYTSLFVTLHFMNKWFRVGERRRLAKVACTFVTVLRLHRLQRMKWRINWISIARNRKLYFTWYFRIHVEQAEDDKRKSYSVNQFDRNDIGTRYTLHTAHTYIYDGRLDGMPCFSHSRTRSEVAKKIGKDWWLCLIIIYYICAASPSTVTTLSSFNNIVLGWIEWRNHVTVWTMNDPNRHIFYLDQNGSVPSLPCNQPALLLLLLLLFIYLFLFWQNDRTHWYLGRVSARAYSIWLSNAPIYPLHLHNIMYEYIQFSQYDAVIEEDGDGFLFCPFVSLCSCACPSIVVKDKSSFRQFSFRAEEKKKKRRNNDDGKLYMKNFARQSVSIVLFEAVLNGSRKRERKKHRFDS